MARWSNKNENFYLYITIQIFFCWDFSGWLNILWMYEPKNKNKSKTIYNGSIREREIVLFFASINSYSLVFSFTLYSLFTIPKKKHFNVKIVIYSSHNSTKNLTLVFEHTHTHKHTIIMIICQPMWDKHMIEFWITNFLFWKQTNKIIIMLFHCIFVDCSDHYYYHKLDGQHCFLFLFYTKFEIWLSNQQQITM